jgi:hypothetical protein
MKYITQSTLIMLGFGVLEVKAFMSPSPPAFKPAISREQGNWKSKHFQCSPQVANTRMSQRYMVTPLMDISVVSHSNVEVEVFADLAHLLLDFATMFSPNTIMLKVFILCGRIFSILSDLTPDGSITTDEFVFQSSMLTLATYNFVKIIVPMIQSSIQTSSFQDRRIYQTIFRPVGFTWSQFKLLVANKSFEWVEIPRKSTLIETKENLLITYRGPVKKISEGNQAAAVYGQRLGKDSHDFIGDLSSTKAIIDSQGTTQTQIQNHKEDCSNSQILMAESESVLLFRINTEKLLRTAKIDPLIDSATKNLFFSAVLSLCDLDIPDPSERRNRTESIDTGHYSYMY